MLGHTSLVIHYKTMFALAQHHKYALSDLNDLMPFERDLYVDMLVEHLQGQKEE